MKIVSAEEMREIDNVAINEIGIPGIVLMENAGRGIFNIIKKDLNKNFVVVCGKGNNGGDGFVISRYLINNQAKVSIFLIGKLDEIKGDAKTNLDILLKTGAKIIELLDDKDLSIFAYKCKEADIIIDAIFGTGFSGKPKDLFAEVIKIINAANKFVIAVDAPSGLNSTTGDVEGDCVKANITCTMCLPKRGLYLYPGKDYVGELYIIDIGVPPQVYSHITTEIVDDIKKILPIRSDNSNKGTFGKIFILAGSKGMTGAATLTSLSALKAGAGIVRLGIPESLNSIIEEKATEVISVPLPETEEATFSEKAIDKILEEIKNAQVVVIGPGISTHPETKSLIQKLLPKINIPMVIDADGINNITPEIIKDIKAPKILTPHPGELSRLTGLTITEIQKLRIDTTIKLAKEWNTILLLKGAPTIISDGKNTFIIPFYNSGLATAGSGDILTGLIAGFLAQNNNVLEAAILGAYIHGLAGELCAKELTKYSMIASDIMEYIPNAIKEIISKY